MAKFNMELPDDVLKDFRRIYDDSEKIFGGMTKAGADIVVNNVKNNVPSSWRDSEIMKNIEVTRTYKTPSDDGINTKVLITGYFKNKNGVRTPAPLVANMFEYGSNSRDFPKQPFFRKSFRKAQIEKAMIQAQKELSGGLLDE